MKRRNLILLLGGASSGAMAVGTGAFSSAQAERGVSVNVVSDDKALVGYDSPSDKKDGKQVTGGSRIDLVTVENRFAEDAKISIEDVTVDVGRDDGERDDGECPQITDVKYKTDEFGSGEAKTICGTVQCDGDSERATVEVTVRLVGEGVSAELFGDTETRRFEIVCREVTTYTAAGGMAVEGVDFKGNGNAEVLSPEGEETEVQIYYVDESGITTTEFETVPVNEMLRGKTSIDGQTIAGIHIKGVDGVFVHPRFDKSTSDVESDGDNGDSRGAENGVSNGRVTQTDNPDDVFGKDLSDD